MSLEPVGRSLQRILEEAGLGQALRGWQALEFWPEVVGGVAAQRSRAISYDAGRLLVEVDGPAWSSQLMFLKRDIVARLNARLGEGVIQDIQFTASRGGR